MALSYRRKPFSWWRLPHWNWKFLIIRHLSIVELNICTEIWWSAAFYEKKIKTAAVRHLEFSKFAIMVLTCDRVWLCFLSPNYALIGHYHADRGLQPKNNFQDGDRVPHCIYCEFIVLHPGTEFYVPDIVLNFEGDWFSSFWCTFKFHHLDLLLPIGTTIWRFGVKSTSSRDSASFEPLSIKICRGSDLYAASKMQK